MTRTSGIDTEIVERRNWDESKHPREPKGDSDGGQFTEVDGYAGYEKKKQRDFKFEEKSFLELTKSKKYDTSNMDDAMGHAARWSLNRGGEKYFISMTQRGYSVSGEQSKVSVTPRFYEITAKSEDGFVLISTTLYESVR